MYMVFLYCCRPNYPDSYHDHKTYGQVTLCWTVSLRSLNLQLDKKEKDYDKSMILITSKRTP